MPPPNLEALIGEHPEHEPALRTLWAWLSGTAEDLITSRRIAREVPVESKALVDALMILVDAGVLRRVYKVMAPSGALADPEFDDPEEIPDKLPDRWENYFDTSEADVVSSFRRVA
jgi:hypothetical protein